MPLPLLLFRQMEQSIYCSSA
ncbi:hypothetical protein PT2222_300049 [Paraburkholderia tropica]